MSQICSRMHIKVSSPDVWKRCADMFRKDKKYTEPFYFGFDLEELIHNKNDYFILDHWSCPRDDMAVLTNAIAGAIGKDGILIADWTYLNSDPFTDCFFYLDRIVCEEYFYYDFSGYRHPKCQMFWDTDIEDIVGWLNCGGFCEANTPNLNAVGIISVKGRAYVNNALTHSGDSSARIYVAVKDENARQKLAAAVFSDIPVTLPDSADKLFGKVGETEFTLDTGVHLTYGSSNKTPLFLLVNEICKAIGKKDCIVLADNAITPAGGYYEYVYYCGNNIKTGVTKKKMRGIQINTPKAWLEALKIKLKDEHYMQMAYMPSDGFNFARDYCKLNGLPINGIVSANTAAFQGLKFCVTGDLVNFPESTRKKFKELIERNGGKLVSSVSSVTSYLVCNDRNSGTTKLRAAKQLNIPIISETEFFDLLEERKKKAEEVPADGQQTNLDSIWKYNEKENGKIMLTGYFGFDTKVVVPDNINGAVVDEIGDSTFSCMAESNKAVTKTVVTARAAIEEIQIPDSIIRIGSKAFLSCKSLTAVMVPDSVTSIGDRAFENCKKLASFFIGSGVTQLGERILFNCKALKTIGISEQNPVFFGNNCIIHREEHTLYAAIASTVITEADNVYYLKDQAYSSFAKLTSLTLPKGLKTVSGFRNYYNCHNALKEVILPDSVTSIGDDAFFDCTGLASITIADGVTSIGNYAFANCSGLTSITIPDGVTSIGYKAFSGCNGLASITIPDSVTSIGDSAFSGCTGLASITIPDSVTSIGDHAFPYCNGLASITIPDSVTSIGFRAFLNCKPEFVIYAHKNSAAQKYAEKNFIKFIEIP